MLTQKFGNSSPPLASGCFSSALLSFSRVTPYIYLSWYCNKFKTCWIFFYSPFDVSGTVWDPKKRIKNSCNDIFKFCKCDPSMTLHFIQHNVLIYIKKKSQLRLTNNKMEFIVLGLNFLIHLAFQERKKI